MRDIDNDDDELDDEPYRGVDSIEEELAKANKEEALDKVFGQAVKGLTPDPKANDQTKPLNDQGEYNTGYKLTHEQIKALALMKIAENNGISISDANEKVHISNISYEKEGEANLGNPEYKDFTDKILADAKEAILDSQKDGKPAFISISDGKHHVLAAFIPEKDSEPLKFNVTYVNSINSTGNDNLNTGKYAIGVLITSLATEMQGVRFSWGQDNSINLNQQIDNACGLAVADNIASIAKAVKENKAPTEYLFKKNDNQTAEIADHSKALGDTMVKGLDEYKKEKNQFLLKPMEASIFTPPPSVGKSAERYKENPTPIPEALDGVVTEPSTTKSNDLAFEEQDEILDAVRTEILKKQEEHLTKVLNEKGINLPKGGYDSLRKMIHDPKQLTPLKLDLNELDKELNKIEVAGYKTVHDRFKDRFQTIDWTKGEKEGTHVKEVKNSGGDLIAKLTQTTHKNAIDISLHNGAVHTIKSYRTIDFPTHLDGDGAGPMHLSMVAKDENGRNMPKDGAVYFTAHYNKAGQLVEISSPEPINFLPGNDEVGYIERGGKIYTLPVTKKKYEEMMLEVSVNKGPGIDLSKAKEASDNISLEGKVEAVKKEEVLEEKKSEGKEVLKNKEALGDERVPKRSVKIEKLLDIKAEEAKVIPGSGSEKSVTTPKALEAKIKDVSVVPSVGTLVGFMGKKDVSLDYQKAAKVTKVAEAATAKEEDASVAVKTGSLTGGPKPNGLRAITKDNEAAKFLEGWKEKGSGFSSFGYEAQLDFINGLNAAVKDHEELFTSWEGKKPLEDLYKEFGKNAKPLAKGVILESLNLIDQEKITDLNLGHKEVIVNPNADAEEKTKKVRVAENGRFDGFKKNHTPSGTTPSSSPAGVRKGILKGHSGPGVR